MCKADILELPHPKVVLPIGTDTGSEYQWNQNMSAVVVFVVVWETIYLFIKLQNKIKSIAIPDYKTHIRGCEL